VRIALVSREVYPYIGGGIAPIVAAAAKLLTQVGEVTLVTSDMHRAEHERLRAEGDDRIVPDAVRMVWVPEPEPEDVGAFMSFMHAYSARVDAALREAYPGRGPDLIEFCDYLGEGFVTVQARHTQDPWLERTRVCVRTHTTAEICAVLDGHVPADSATIAVHDAERYVLRHADRLLWPGGDVLEMYRRYYGAGLAPDVRIPDAFLVELAAGGEDPLPPPSDDGPLQLLYLGRAERRKGVQNLLRAMTSTARDDVCLTLLGGDTLSGPVQTSLRTQLELMGAGDPRIRFLDPVPRAEVERHIREAHALVVPSLWECWPNVVREALMHNRPVLGTPVGGLCEMVVPGRTGWLARDTSVPALVEAIERLADSRGEVHELIAAGGPRAHFETLTDPDAFVERYRALAASPLELPARRRAPAPAQVSVVIPYFKLDALIGETLASVRAQTHPDVEIVVVNDGSLREQDEFLYDMADRGELKLVTQANAGLSAARNMGIGQARGRYVLPLDADDVIEPSFVERCLEALERDPDLAYVTTWVAYMEPDGTPIEDEGAGYMPLGNWSRLIERNNVGGTCAALFRRRLFELGFRYSPDMTSYEDWLLYLQLARAGHHGAVVPERLFRYRVRPKSMMRTDGAPRTEIIVGEIAAHLREGEVRWVSSHH
jgi:glycosyltransferase involved in cell wall biosynthesis